MEDFMRRVILLIAITAAASLAAAQDQSNILIPDSSIEKPGDIGVRMHTNYYMRVPDPQVTPDAPPPGVTIETPGSIACIYDLVSSPISGCPVATATKLATGGNGTIVLVDAYDDPSAAADLSTFSTRWGLPAANFTVQYASGTKPPNACASGWEGEEALDIQWAHAMAPKADIVLMEAASSSTDDLFAAVLQAALYVEVHNNFKGEVSMSWGSTEYSLEALNDVFLLLPDVVYFASSGDSSGVSYPSASPFVVSAGGTQIDRNSSGNYTKQVATTTCGTGCGGGVSAYETRPSYQNGVSGVVGAARGTPDLASDSSSKSPVWVYDSSCYGGWLEVWGTSVAAPTLAGVINSAGSFKADSNAELTEVYNDRKVTSAYTDITSGGCATHSAKSGYDLCAGVGVVKAKKDK
jgi:kumamolisin